MQFLTPDADGMQSVLPTLFLVFARPGSEEVR